LEVSEEDKVKAIGIVSRGAHHKFDEKFLNQLPNLRYIALFQIGVDNVDLDFCKKR
jgi:lactate dehydrogenase-like 2-hydroxyacid dehydrogenase